MKTIRTQIIEYLDLHPEGVDDDQLTGALKLKHRQQANNRCRQLAEEGFVDRRKLNGKICNFLIVDATTALQAKTRRTAVDPSDQPWFWEGNVQNTVVEYLKKSGHTIVNAVDTASREQGKDIEATKDGKTIWITVKGYPKGTPRTRPSTQAEHWFKGAVFDLLKWRGESREAVIAVAFPDYPRYRKLLKKISWSLPVIRFDVFWVRKDQTVELQGNLV